MPDAAVLKEFVEHLPGTEVDESGSTDFVRTVDAICDQFIASNAFPPTPLYRYELFDQALPYDVHLKLDNLQRFGDVQARAFGAIVLLNHAATMGLPPSQAGVPDRVVLCVSPDNYSTQHYLQEICYVARHLGAEVDIYVSLSGLSLWVLYQLYNCREIGANVNWVSVRSVTGGSPDSSEVATAVWAAARAASATHDTDAATTTLIDPVHDREYALVGIATAVHEMLHAQPDLGQIVVPIRHYSTGWTTLAGIALYAAIITERRAAARSAAATPAEAAALPGPLVVAAAQLRSDLDFQGDLPGTRTRREALFHDVGARLWLTNRRAETCAEAVFEAWDKDGDGELTRSEILDVLRDLRAPLGREVRISQGKRRASTQAGAHPAAATTATTAGGSTTDQISAVAAAATAAVEGHTTCGIYGGASVCVNQATGAAPAAVSAGSIRNPAMTEEILADAAAAGMIKGSAPVEDDLGSDDGLMDEPEDEDLLLPLVPWPVYPITCTAQAGAHVAKAAIPAAPGAPEAGAARVRPGTPSIASMPGCAVTGLGQALSCGCLDEASCVHRPGDAADGADAEPPLCIILSAFRALLNDEAARLDVTARSAMASFHAAVSISALKFHGLVTQIVSVTEEESAAAFLACLNCTHTHVSGRGAAAVASVLSGRLRAPRGTKIGVLVSGGTVEPRQLDSVLAYSLQNNGQLYDLEVTLPNDTCVTVALLGLVKRCGCSVMRINTSAGTSPAETRPVPLYHARVRLSLVADSVRRLEELQRLIVEQGWTVHPMLTRADIERLSGWPGLGPANSDNLPPIRFSTVCEVTPSVEAAGRHGLVLDTETGRALPALETDATPSPAPGAGADESEYSYCSDLRALNDITPTTIERALARLRDSGSIWRTMCYRSSHYSRVCGCDVHLILENTQKTGSFKIRGSSNMLIKAVESGQRPPGVVACSAGNHAQGVAYTCARLGIPCCIVCPSYAPVTKLAATRRYGAEVQAVGDSFEEAAAHAAALTKERGWHYLHPYAALDVIEGQGTIGAELAAAVPDVDTVLVNVGGGGLISGISLYLKKRAAAMGRKVRIVGVQAAAVAPLQGSEATGTLHYVPPHAQTLADGVNVKVPGSTIHDEALFSLVDEYISVPENEIAATITHGLIHTRTLCEGAGVLGVAALIYGRVRVSPGEKVAVVNCGGNIDIPRLRQVAEFGFRALGRALTIEVDVGDHPGALLSIIDAAAANTVAVRRVHHQRATNTAWTMARISLDLWTSGFEAQNRFLSTLADRGMHPVITGRTAIPHANLVYHRADEAVAQADARVSEAEEQAAKLFAEAEAKRRAARIEHGHTLTDCGKLREISGKL